MLRGTCVAHLKRALKLAPQTCTSNVHLKRALKLAPLAACTTRLNQHFCVRPRVVTICPKAAFTQLQGWSTRLGGVEFQELTLLKHANEGRAEEGEEEKDGETADTAEAMAAGPAVQSPW